MPINHRICGRPDLSRTALCHELVELKAAVMEPVPKDYSEEELLHTKDPRLTLLYESSLAYLKGDFSRVLSCYRQAEKDLPVRLNLCPAAMASAVSLGDQQAYGEIEIL